ncbi:MAG: undecaprenyl-diphosphate phosphatase [Evtepia sp.]|uniref:undecaprenyl-diphosphate phosphatase n=1 Tax=Evtepia sp. TaxID=2773933 RepID=UPI002A74F127|nr:undecaprenyl-diphosphate phosphatase [Evtepia sp.]MDY3014098.1 undecaprenyl-diphosphate phosphatase [Evtepia sp.]
MNFLSSIFLGLVQGIAEFLPISSSGHLSLFQHFFGMSDPESSMFFNVLLHLGTLIAIFVYYWKDIVALFKELILIIKNLFSKKEKGEKPQRLSPRGRMIVMIIVATLPLFVVYPIKDQVEKLYGNTVFVGFALLVTGTLLFFSDRIAKGKKAARSTTMVDALLIGVGQAVAVVPGLSRSGTSISVGMMRGLKRKFAVRFSFLLSIPAVLGANIVSIGDAVKEGIDVSLLPAYIVGTIVAAVSGYFAIRLVNLLADKGKFGNFAYYCWGIGAAAIVATLIFH